MIMEMERNMLEKNTTEKNRILIAISLIIIGVIGRLSINGLLPNTPSIYITINGITQPMFMMDLFFVVAVVAIISGLLLGGYYTFIVPISVMVVSDLILGNTWILLFTWSGFAIIGLIGYILKKKHSLSLKKVPTVIGAGIGGVLIYDLWTNFGCWLGWYPHTLSGLTICYTVAIPFMLWHLLSATVALTIVILPIVYLKEHEIIKTDFLIRPFEKRITVIAPALLMILAVIALAV